MSTMSGGPNIVTNGLVLNLDAANTKSFRGIPTTNYLTTPEAEVTKGEFGQYYNLVSIFETYGLVPYSLSFDMKANRPGSVLWYMQNGSWTKYDFVYTSVDVTTEWQRFKIQNVTPSGPTAGWSANTPGDNRAMLASYTTYGSGVNPTVRNMQLELGAVSTPFVVGTRGATFSTGGGWVDRTSNSNHGELVNGPTFNAANQGSIVFDGSNDYILVNSNTSILSSTAYTKIAWFYPTSLATNNNIISGTNSAQHAFWLAGGNKLNAGHNGNWSTVVSTSTISINNWYFGAVTFSTTSGWNLYFNGVSESTSVSTTTFTGDGRIQIGAYEPAGNPFTGRIANVLVYNRVLTATEISQIYNTTKSRFGLS